MDVLIDLLKRELNVDFPICPDVPLISSGLIDSLRFAELLTALETHYGVAIDQSEVGADNFDSPAQIYAFLMAKCASKPEKPFTAV